MSLRKRVEDLALVMQEFGLGRAKWKGDFWSVELSRFAPGAEVASVAVPEIPASSPAVVLPPPAPEAPTGQPVASPTTGVFYTAPSPGAPPFVKVGDRVEVGQAIGLIEAMKVFSEVTSTLAGEVTRIVAENGQLVYPGDTLVELKPDDPE